MHIEPGVVADAKTLLGYVTAAGALSYTARIALDGLRDRGPGPLAVRAVLATGAVFAFFEIFPHHPVGVSEVHMILGSTLFLLFGAGPAAIGLVLGLLAQGMFFAPGDLPQLGMNITTLLVPLFAMSWLARRIIPARTAYKDIRYGQAFALSLTYQGGIVAWVGFWALYGQGTGAENLTRVAGFGAAYMLVVLIEPLIDLAVLALAKTSGRFRDSGLFTRRLFSPAP